MVDQSDKKLAAAHGIENYPTLLVFDVNSPEPVKYEGPQAFASIGMHFLGRLLLLLTRLVPWDRFFLDGLCIQEKQHCVIAP